MELSGNLTVSLALYVIPQAKYTYTPPGVESLRLFTAVDVVILCCDFCYYFFKSWMMIGTQVQRKCKFQAWIHALLETFEIVSLIFT